MKIRNIITLALAGSLVAAACTKEMATDSFEDIKVSSTFVTFSPAGESKDVVVTATKDWKFIVDENFPKVLTFNKKDGSTIKATHDYYGNLTNKESDIKSSKASWLEASVLEGKAGETTVKFTAKANDAGREITIAILCGTDKQYLTFRQGDLSPVVMTCKEINENAIAGASYIVKGIVTKLGNYSSYGAFWVNDGTTDTDVQIYGSTKSSRETYSDVEVGDSVKFKGSWSSYKNFENVEISEHVKSLLKILTTSTESVAKAGGNFEVRMAYKGNGVLPSVPEKYQDWVSIVSITSKKGVATKLESNPADTATVKIKVAANEGEPREASIDFTSSTSSASYTFSQDGEVLAATVAELTAQITGTSASPSSYTVKFADNAPAVVSYVNGSNVFIEDATGGILLYKKDHTFKAGQKITGKINGSGYKFSGLPEITSLEGATVTDGTDIPCTEITLSDLLANFNRYISCRVIVKNVTVSAAIAGKKSGMIKQGDSEITVMSKAANAALDEGKQGDFITYPTVYNTTKELFFFEPGQFTAKQ